MSGGGSSSGGKGSGHPLPESEESRHDEIPESLEDAKGEGDDGAEAAREGVAVNPDGEPYPT
jgi:hypothetical protein